MSVLTDQFERDVESCEVDLSDSFVWHGVTVICQKDTSRIGLRMLNAGYDGRRRTNIICRLSSFGAITAPGTNDLITLDGILWRVDEDVVYSQDGITIDLPLVQSN